MARVRDMRNIKKVEDEQSQNTGNHPHAMISIQILRCVKEVFACFTFLNSFVSIQISRGVNGVLVARHIQLNLMQFCFTRGVNDPDRGAMVSYCTISF